MVVGSQRAILTPRESPVSARSPCPYLNEMHRALPSDELFPFISHSAGRPAYRGMDLPFRPVEHAERAIDPAQIPVLQPEELLEQTIHRDRNQISLRLSALELQELAVLECQIGAEVPLGPVLHRNPHFHPALVRFLVHMVQFLQLAVESLPRECSILLRDLRRYSRKTETVRQHQVVHWQAGRKLTPLSDEPTVDCLRRLKFLKSCVVRAEPDVVLDDVLVVLRLDVLAVEPPIIVDVAGDELELVLVHRAGERRGDHKQERVRHGHSPGGEHHVQGGDQDSRLPLSSSDYADDRH